MINLRAQILYRERMEVAEERVNHIRTLLKRHDKKAGTTKHWGHTADLAYVLRNLADIEYYLVLCNP